MVVITVSLIVSSITLNVEHSGKNGRPMATWLKKVFNNLIQNTKNLSKMAGGKW